MRYLIVIILCFFGLFVLAQDKDEADKNLLHYFTSGTLSGQIRDFSMATVNKGILNDYYANAVGASIHFETLPLKGFSLGLNGIFVYRTFSNDLLSIDSIANSSSLYELQLFDVEHKGNYTDLDRLEELYIKYQTKKLRVMYGKMEILSPLINLHDGRMKPKVFSGFQTNYLFKDNTFNLAWFSKASPRSITHWFNIEDAIGLYNNGYISDTTKADYHYNIASNGLGIFGFESKKISSFKLNVWNYYLDNISNTSFLKLDCNRDTGFYGGVMYLYQTPLNNGGSENPIHTYHNVDERTNLISGSIGRHFKFCDVNLNATHILNTGKFIFPREFGVDPTYTYISRSQIEGQGNATSFGITGEKKMKNASIRLDWNQMLTDQSTKFNKYK
ncbi:MAG: hypothetical protein KJP21_09455, partial [Bacteroidia bacterium]|nr:hypothetical protein [Bacteroidia bacterium]